MSSTRVGGGRAAVGPSPSAPEASGRGPGGPAFAGARQSGAVTLAQLSPLEAHLRPPQLRPGDVERQGPLGKLDRPTDVALVVAPPGYGKTTLLAHWSARHHPTAWRTVGPEDNDPVVFIASIARSLQEARPLAPEALDELADCLLTPFSRALPRVTSILWSSPAPVVLVLDDVHLLEDDRCHRVLEMLVEELPSGSRLVLGGRSLPIRSARLEAQRRVTRLGAEDLAMTEVEARTMLARAGIELDGGAFREVLSAAEGWPAGVYLLALGRSGRRPVPATDDRIVADFLRDEVLQHLSGSTVEFMLRTSILSVVDPEICDALLDTERSGSVLAGLAESNRFVIPLEGEPPRFRYHSLLQRALISELQRRDPASHRGLHARASELLADRGLLDEAIRHARLVGDKDRAVELVWTSFPYMAATGRAATVEGWLGHFDDRDFQERPELPLARAWCNVTASQTEPISLWIDLARHHDPLRRLTDGTPLGTVVAALDAVAGEGGVRAMVRSAEDALRLDDRESLYSVAALLVLGAGRALLGEPEEARRVFATLLNYRRRLPVLTLHANAQMAELALAEGDWEASRRQMDRALAMAAHFRVTEQPFLAILAATAAKVASHDGDLTRAGELGRRAAELVARSGHILPWLRAQIFLNLAIVRADLGERTASRRFLEQGRALVDEIGDAPVLVDMIIGLDERTGRERRHGEGCGHGPALSAAERRLLPFLPTHLTYHGIAGELVISPNTVKTQVASIFRKLGATSRDTAVQRARHLGLLDRPVGSGPG